MGNNSVNTGNPLLSPQQLWSKPAQPRPQTQLPGTIPMTPPAGKPATPALPGQIPTPLPGSLPGASLQGTTPTYTPPVDTIGAPPPQGSSIPQVPFTQQVAPQPSAPATPSLGQLTQMFRSGDDSLLGKYGVQLAKDQQGQITGYFVNGQQVTQPQLQQHLLPHASFLHQELENLKTSVDQSYTAVYGQMQKAFPTMTPAEQQSIQIQMQAVHVIYESFVNRLNQIDGLIR